MQQRENKPTFFHLPKNQGGYTLIELLVVIALIAILVTVSFFSLDTGNLREQTRAAADNLRTDLKAQQESSLANKVDSSGNPASFYGILLSNSAPITSYSLVRLEKYPAPQVFSCLVDIAKCNTTVTSAYTFDQGVSVSVISPANLKAIMFAEQSGVPTFYSSLGTKLNGPARLRVSGTGNTFTISVSAAGTVSVSSEGLPTDSLLARVLGDKNRSGL